MCTKKKSTQQKNKFECQYCSKKYIRESSFNKHNCQYKERFEYKDSRVFKTSFGIFLKYYKRNGLCLSTKVEPIMQFIKSPYFMDFIIFGDYCIENDIIYKEEFIEYIIGSTMPIYMWTTSDVYTQWVQDKSKSEPITTAILRSIEYMMEWEKVTGNKWNTFFERVSSERAKYCFETGKVSPWIMAVMPISTQNKLLSRLPESDLAYINKFIKRTEYSILALRNKDEILEIQQLLQGYEF